MWLPYVTVANLKDAVAKATSLGAGLARDITAIPEMGSFAIITDPQGATLGLWEFAK
jgi:predicted enzyme related to lactoylglutathione lyase